MYYHKIPYLSSISGSAIDQANFNARMDYTSNKHSQVVIAHWDNFCNKLTESAGGIVVDGHSLDIATLVAVARSALNI